MRYRSIIGSIARGIRNAVFWLMEDETRVGSDGIIPKPPIDVNEKQPRYRITYNGFDYEIQYRFDEQGPEWMTFESHSWETQTGALDVIVSWKRARDKILRQREKKAIVVWQDSSGGK